MAQEEYQVPQEIMDMHKRLDALQKPVIENLAVTKGWGFGRIIQICHELWDESLVKEGIAGHSKDYQFATVEVMLDQQAAKQPEHADEFLRLSKALAEARRKMK